MPIAICLEFYLYLFAVVAGIIGDAQTLLRTRRSVSIAVHILRLRLYFMQVMYMIDLDEKSQVMSVQCTS